MGKGESVKDGDFYEMFRREERFGGGVNCYKRAGDGFSMKFSLAQTPFKLLGLKDYICMLMLYSTSWGHPSPNCTNFRPQKAES